MRAVLYHRVSTRDQNPDAARVELRAAAAARGYEVAEEIEEIGSGARNDRPGWCRVMELAARHKVEAVIVWKADRAGRSTLDLLANVKALTEKGVTFVASTQGLTVGAGGDSASRLTFTVLAAVAEYEREMIKERTALGLERAARHGRHPGRKRNPGAPTPAAVQAARARGLSWSQVAAELGCHPSAARRALVENGPPKTPGFTEENPTP